jgi:rRNA-processing protein FCF1
VEVILDTNFIISCIRKKIDFYEQLTEQGFKVVFPREVLQELKDVRRKNGTSHEDRIAIDLAMQMIERMKVKKMSLGQGKVDDWLISKGKEGYYIATLDAVIKRQVPKRVVIFDAQKRVGVE